MGRNQALRTTLLNGLVAALYVVFSMLAGMMNLAAGPVQFRFSESLNHLVVFNKKYIWGVVLGVLLYNALFSTLYDVIFGGAQTLIALGIIALTNKYIPKIWERMVLNTILFTVSMALVAWMIVISPTENGAAPAAFWLTYGSLALSEFVMMAISAPVMYGIDKLAHFSQRMDGQVTTKA